MKATRAPTTTSTGQWAETLAFEHLHAAGLTEVTRNYRCRVGEIDLVMRDGPTLVFVEVRYRGRSDFGSGAASVGSRKQAHLINSAQHFLQRNSTLAKANCRFDVIGVAGPPAGPRIEWIRDAFRA